jgi:hypothetical protein
MTPSVWVAVYPTTLRLQQVSCNKRLAATNARVAVKA